MSKQPKQERTRSPYHATKEISQNNKKISVLDFPDSGEDESNTEKDLVAQKIANYGIKNKKDNFQTQTYSVNKFTIPQNQKKVTNYNKYEPYPKSKSKSYQNEKINLSGVKKEDLKLSQTHIYRNPNGNYSKLYIPKEQIGQNQLLDIVNNDNDNTNELSRKNLTNESKDKLKKFVNLLEKKEKEKGMEGLKNYNDLYKNKNTLNKLNELLEQKKKKEVIEDLNKNKDISRTKEGLNKLDQLMEKKKKENDDNIKSTVKVEVEEMKDDDDNKKYNVVKTDKTVTTTTKIKKNKKGKKTKNYR